MKQFELYFDGYWREENKASVPKFSGIYLIYTCKYNKDAGTVSLSRNIYIGKAKNLNSRIADHNEQEFKDFIAQGETLCYACAPVKVSDLDLVENALIFAEKPVANTMLKDCYSYQDAGFSLEGACDMLEYTSFNITTPKHND